MPLPVIVVACKSESTTVPPDTVANFLDLYHIGLVEATATDEKGKNKMRMALIWIIHALLRQRRRLSPSASLASTGSSQYPQAKQLDSPNTNAQDSFSDSIIPHI